MTTRRDIISGLGIIGIIAAGKAPAAVVKSMLGTGGIKQVEAIEMPTATDYVQDGLIAMWDGIENAGHRRHDATATTWIDLVGDADLVIQTTGGIPRASFTKNSLYSASKEIEQAIHAPVESLLYPRTIEIVFKRLSGITGTLVLFGTGDKSSQPKRLVHCTAGGIVRGIAGTTNFPTCNIDVSIVNTVSFIYSSDTQVSAAYANGVISSTKGSSSWSLTSPYLGVASYHNSNYGFAGDMYNVRFYSRALVEEEVAYNYAIDKERFGL